MVSDAGYQLYRVSPRDRMVLADAKSLDDLLALLKQRQYRDVSRLGIALAIAKPKYLLRSAELPKAALIRLGGILSLDVERLTPFKAADVISAARFGTATKSGMVEVGHLIAKRADLDPLIAGLLANKFVVKGMFAQLSSDEWMEFDPVEPIRRVQSKLVAWVGRMQTMTLMTGIGCLALAAFIYDHKLSQTIDDLDEQIAILRTSAAKIGKRFDEIQSSTETMTRLGKRRTEIPTTVAMIDELTRLIPDDAWVQTMIFDKDQISLNIQAKASAPLLQVIEQSPLFKSAKYTSPVSKDAAGQTETVSLGFEREPLVPAGQGGP